MKVYVEMLNSKSLNLGVPDSPCIGHCNVLGESLGEEAPHEKGNSQAVDGSDNLPNDVN